MTPRRHIHCLTTHHTICTGEVQVQPHAFLTSALDRGEWLASHPSHSMLGKSPLVPIA